MLWDMLESGALQSRITTAAGISVNAATMLHPTKEAVPDM